MPALVSVRAPRRLQEHIIDTILATLSQKKHIYLHLSPICIANNPKKGLPTFTMTHNSCHFLPWWDTQTFHSAFVLSKSKQIVTSKVNILAAPNHRPHNFISVINITFLFLHLSNRYLSVTFYMSLTQFTASERLESNFFPLFIISSEAICSVSKRLRQKLEFFPSVTCKLYVDKLPNTLLLLELTW